jgi:Fe-Mn family superoxide dismutase
MAHELPRLDYDYDALEPHIDAKTMEIHHTKHHAGYVSKLNAALADYPDLQKRSITELLGDLSAVPEAIRADVRNNGGGHFNHTMFWRIMKPKGGGQPSGELAEAIRSTFGSFDELKTKFTDSTVSRFGSGWAWLYLDRGRLEIGSTPNQDSPVMEGRKPVLGLDVWEHAYYLKYQNRRPEYVQAFWHVVDWNQVAENFKKASKS